MKDAYTWGAILVIVLASSTGDVLLSRAMKQIGDVGKYSRRAGLLAVVSRALTPRNRGKSANSLGTRTLP